MAAANPAHRPILDDALEYLHAEIPVFPVCSPLMRGHKHRDPDTQEIVVCGTGTLRKSLGKTPLIRWRGYQKSLPSEDDVRGWWARWPDANIGFATGELSGILVLDTDGTEAQTKCLQLGGLDETPTLWTGKIGGAHFHLEYPGGDVRNFAGKMPGTDLRGQGGYALLPPSLHASGNRYRWVEQTRGIPASRVPAWLTALIESDANEGGDSVFGDDFNVDDVLQGVPEGKRDDTLYRYACRLRRDDVLQTEAEEKLRLAARACQPPFDEAIAVGKVRRAYKEFQPTGSPNVDFDEEFWPPSAATSTSPDPASFVFSRPISELLDTPDEEPDWMVEQLFTVASNGWIGAEPKVGKSWAGLELSYSLSTGDPFLGRFAIPERRKVLYIQEEDSKRRVRRRLGQIIRGNPMRSRPEDAYFRYAIREGFRIDNPVWIEILRRDILGFGPDVILLDVFNRLHGKNENDQQEMTEILRILTDFTNEYGCAFIVVHHDRKPQMGNEARGNQRLRGSGVLGGWGECSLYLRRGKEKDTIIVTPESKDAPEMDDFQFTIEDQPNGGVILQIGEVAIKGALTLGDTAVLEAVDTLTHRGIGATTKAVAEAVGRDRSTTQTRLTRLVESGYLTATAISEVSNATKIYRRAEAE